MIIDIHSHFFPLELINEARVGAAFDGLTIQNFKGREFICHRQGSRYPLVKEFFDLNAKIQQMDQLNIDLSLLSLSPTLLMYWVNSPETNKFCTRMNDLLAKFISESKDKFLGFATVPLQNVSYAISELKRAVIELEFCGVQIGTSVEAVALDDGRLFPFFDEVSRLDIPILIHPYAVGKRDRMEDFHFNNMIGNPLDTELAAARMIFSGFLDRYPDLKIILAHGGGFLPYQIGRFDHIYHMTSKDHLPNHPPSYYLKRFFYDTILFEKQPLDFLYQSVGAQNILIGTDSPFDAQDRNFEQNIEVLSMEEIDKESIYSGNARKIFKLNL